MYIVPLAVCRVCLANNVKIHSIINSQLQVIYEELTSCKLNTEDGRPTSVCYLCYSQLQRCRRFSEQTQKSGDILTELCRNGIVISPATVTILNQVLQNNFCVTPIEYITYNYPHGGTQPAVKLESDDVNDIKHHFKHEEVLVANADVCRACLAGNVRTHSITNTPLQDIYETLTKFTKLNTGNMTVCYMCHAQLQKCWKLVNKSKKSENILNELVYNGIQLTQSLFCILNQRIKPAYSSTPVKCISADGAIEDSVVKAELLQMDVALVEDDTKNKHSLIDEFTVKTDPDEPKPETIVSEIKSIDVGYIEHCDLCIYKSSSTSRYKKHALLHDQKRKFPCDICSYRFKSLANLKYHRKFVHNLKFKCGKCEESFSNMSKYNKHMLTHTAQHLYPCEKCSMVFLKRKNLRSHYDRLHHGERYPCDRCTFSSSSLQWLHDHILRVHAESAHYICDICHRTLTRKRSLKKHIQNHTARKSHKCDICFKTFITNQNLKIHYMNHTGIKPHACNQCEKRFKKAHLLREHQLTHARLKLFSCGFCNKEFHRKTLLKRHTSIHREKLFACDFCDLKFINNAYVKRHMITHSEERPYTCNVCQKTFKLMTALKSHGIVHNGERVYTCDKCKKSFTRKANLVSHLRLHAAVKSFACRTCDKYFLTKQTLKLHNRIHTGEKPHACDRCDRKFSQKCALLRHIKSHKKETPYSCEACGKKFAEKRSLRTHNLTAHSAKKTRFICDICNRVYIDKRKMCQHVALHNTKTPYECDSCFKSFAKLSNLTHHVREHIGEKVQCAFCVETFDSRNSVDRHSIYSHGAVKRYACNICEAPFDGLLRLNSHMRVHTGEKQFSCELCLKTYVEKRDLLHHMITVHSKLECF